MTGLLMKLAICPIVILLSSFLLLNVNYVDAIQPILIGLMLAVAAHLMELVLLRRGTLWISLAADFVVATFFIYFISDLFAGTYVTFAGAVIVALILGITEYFQHLYLIRSGKTRKMASR